MLPVLLKCAGPLMQRTDRLRIGAIQLLPTLTAHTHQAHTFQNPQVLRNRRLLKAECSDNIAYSVLLRHQETQNCPAPRFRDCIEGVGSGSCSCHAEKIHSYMGICQALKSKKMPGPSATSSRM